MSEPSQRPAIASSSVSVILFAPALTSETADALSGWRQYLDTLGRPCEILLIHEGVPSEDPAVRSFPYEQSQGFRAALNDAIRAAQFPLLAFSTADRQYQPADLERMLKVIDKVDLVVGYRAGGQAPPWRVLLDTIFTVFGLVVLGIPAQKRVSWLGAAGWRRRWIARWLFGVGVIDPECPFRLARRALFERLPIQSGGPFVNVEVLAKANHMGCLLAEEVVAWSPPSLPESAAISFGHDARLVFRHPLFV
jgi:glycosyltransferase involved in cell wall biosynthesis